MSRLDSMIRRLEAQRDGIAWGADQIGGAEGDILEVGLGNGRTYDHLRETFPNREIWVVERDPNAHPDSTPPADRLLAMEADAALTLLKRDGIRVALAHYDLGIGVAAVDRPLATGLSRLIDDLLIPGAAVLSNNPLEGLAIADGPASVARERYFFYRK
ncbi:MAG: class I SAM-dependent methyltransferase [Rhodobacteraceae bacterium]|nr:class I SAM-dependent methyltransferase [Paracoccaceae bacterium]